MRYCVEIEEAYWVYFIRKCRAERLLRKVIGYGLTASSLHEVNMIRDVKTGKSYPTKRHFAENMK